MEELRIRPLIPGEQSLVEKMTFPAYRHFLALDRCARLPNENVTEIVDPVVLVAEIDGTPVGLAVADLPIDEEIAPRLLSLFVGSEFRNRGVGSRLIEEVTAVVRADKREKIETVYTTGKPSIIYLESALNRLGWSAPETRMVSIRLDVERAKEASWLWRQRLSPGWEIFDWKDLTDQDRRAIRESNEQERWIAPDLQPWLHDANGFEDRTSLGIRWNGVVVGWNITHLMSEDTLRFTCSFIRKPLGRRGKILPLYAESFRRMMEAGLAYATLTVPLHHGGMRAFSKRWIGPWSQFVGETRGREKLLTRPSAIE